MKIRGRGGKFTRDQIKRLSNILDNLGQVTAATLIIPFLFAVDKPPSGVLPFGLVATTVSWWISLRLERMSS